MKYMLLLFSHTGRITIKRTSLLAAHHYRLTPCEDSLGLKFSSCRGIARMISSATSTSTWEDFAYYATPLAAGYIGYKIITNIHQNYTIKKQHLAMKEIARAKRLSRDNVMHNTLKLSPEKYHESCLDMDGVALTDMIRGGKISVTDALIISAKRSNTIGKELNAVTEECYDDAYAFAQELERRRADGQIVPSDNEVLYGVPVSIKDGFQQKGYDCSMGTAVRCFKPYPEDGLLVKALKHAGAIPFVRSNIPQLLMMPESENIIWGVCENPWDITRTSGGSSGGEASLISARCSVCGLGSDIGGSIRIPAHYTGICGFKPTPMRMSLRGQSVPRKDDRNGQIAIRPTCGPMARSVRDCERMMNVLLSPFVFEGDPTIPRIPWDAQSAQTGLGRRLKIAYMTTDGYFEPVPACKRAVMEAVEVLKSQGHEVVPFEIPYSTAKLVETYIALMGADGNWHYYLKALDGEDLYESYKLLQIYTEIPNFLRPWVAWLLNLSGESRKAKLVEATSSGGLSVRQYWEAIADRNEATKAYTEAFEAHGYDALVMPGLGITAPQHGKAADLLLALSYTFLANLLHWPAGTVPVTCVNSTEETYPLESLPVNQRDSIAKLVQQSIVNSTGLPVGVQVMTPMWQDEKCLYVMSEIEKGVNFTRSPPLTQY